MVYRYALIWFTYTHARTHTRTHAPSRTNARRHACTHTRATHGTVIQGVQVWRIRSSEKCFSAFWVIMKHLYYAFRLWLFKFHITNGNMKVKNVIISMHNTDAQLLNTFSVYYHDLHGMGWSRAGGTSVCCLILSRELQSRCLPTSTQGFQFFTLALMT